ncbi:hypothetical protein FHS78_003576 [Parvibaculum indicum]|uniref:hypothetical protein n=1 Tax=Parvibaculum indicum TaxID=562969 RepID=UPI0014221FB6|nr:hypothetical protein [Parvibaculum indicum]NIJ43264.1 hypothetical protein [Parvibaculum indicum]
MRQFLVIALALAAPLALGGCAVTASPVTGPEGKTAYSMKCSGYMRTLDDCYKKAGELCPTGYTIDAMPTSAIGPGSYMMISCKDKS